MMEFDEIVVKESPGLCRCCLSEGCYKDLGSEHSWMSETEIYADMLLECFDISISQHPTGPNGSNRLICEVCITRLRDACNFKKQVLKSEKRFVDMVGRGEFRPKVLLYQTQMKTELSMEIEEDTGADDAEVEYLEDDGDYVDEDLLKNEDYGEPSVSEDITVSALAVKGKRGRPKKSSTTVKPEKKAKVPKLEEKPTKSKAVAKVPGLNAVSTDETDKFQTRRLLLTIITNSTAMPFRRYGNVYRCFYCHLNFHLAHDLKEHYKEHEEKYLRKAVKRYPLRQAVKLDISELKCKQCRTEFTSLKDLLTHLNEVHDENCCIDYEAHIDCFKLADGELKCLVCNDAFSFFGPLLLHTLRLHRRKRIICETCGQAFSTKSSINRHNQSAHTKESFKCRHCDKKFLAVHRRDDHEKRIHNEKERKCHICGEILGSTYKRVSHLATVHDFKTIEYKCEVCPRVFRFQNQVVKHNKRVHLKEKTKVCDVCGDKFFDNHLLSLHKVKHSDAKPFECGVCNKKFPRKRALDIHTRIHTNDRRFVCKLCGKAFVQTTSLKLHVRVHHSDEEAN